MNCHNFQNHWLVKHYLMRLGWFSSVKLNFILADFMMLKRMWIIVIMVKIMYHLSYFFLFLEGTDLLFSIKDYPLHKERPISLSFFLDKVWMTSITYISIWLPAVRMHPLSYTLAHLWHMQSHAGTATQSPPPEPLEPHGCVLNRTWGLYLQYETTISTASVSRRTQPHTYSNQ